MVRRLVSFFNLGQKLRLIRCLSLIDPRPEKHITLIHWNFFQAKVFVVAWNLENVPSVTVSQVLVKYSAPSQYKDGLSGYGDFHYKVNTVVRLCYLYNGIFISRRPSGIWKRAKHIPHLLFYYVAVMHPILCCCSLVIPYDAIDLGQHLLR